MVAKSENELKKIMNALSKTGKKYAMKINVKKTKVYRDGSKRKIGNDEQVLEQVNQFRYLVSLISDDGACTADIKRRIAMAKNAFNKRRELLSQRMSKDLKL